MQEVSLKPSLSSPSWNSKNCNFLSFCSLTEHSGTCCWCLPKNLLLLSRLSSTQSLVSIPAGLSGHLNVDILHNLINKIESAFGFSTTTRPLRKKSQPTSQLNSYSAGFRRHLGVFFNIVPDSIELQIFRLQAKNVNHGEHVNRLPV